MSAVPKQAEFALYRNRAEELAELREIVKRDSFETGEFTLASGKVSNLYFNMKPTIMPAPTFSRACQYSLTPSTGAGSN